MWGETAAVEGQLLLLWVALPYELVGVEDFDDDDFDNDFDDEDDGLDYF